MWQACILSDKTLQNVHQFSFERAKIHVHHLFQGGTSFVDISCFCFVMPLYASVYLCLVVTCWERAYLLAFVWVSNCEFVTFPLVSWVRCGTGLYRFLIFAPLLTFKSFLHIHLGYTCLFAQLSVYSFLTSRYNSSPLTLILVIFHVFLI